MVIKFYSGRQLTTSLLFGAWTSLIKGLRPEVTTKAELDTNAHNHAITDKNKLIQMHTFSHSHAIDACQ